MVILGASSHKENRVPPRPYCTHGMGRGLSTTTVRGGRTHRGRGGRQGAWGTEVSRARRLEPEANRNKTRSDM